jgi:hypothetical protein
MKTLAKNTYLYQVKQWLESGKTITSKQAIESLGCTRLSAVIFRLINEYGLPITKAMVPVQNRNGRWVEIAKYYLMDERPVAC